MAEKLSQPTKILLRLIKKDRNEDGWAKVSDQVLPFINEISFELVLVVKNSEGNFVKLTDEGEIVAKWLC